MHIYKKLRILFFITFAFLHLYSCFLSSLSKDNINSEKASHMVEEGICNM